MSEPVTFGEACEIMGEVKDHISYYDIPRFQESFEFLADRLVEETLVCSDCDLDGPGTLSAAIEAGWKGIEFAPFYPSAWFLGLCPECQMEGCNAQ